MKKRKGYQSSTIRGEHKGITIEYEEMAIEEFLIEHPQFSYGRRKIPE